MNDIVNMNQINEYISNCELNSERETEINDEEINYRRVNSFDGLRFVFDSHRRLVPLPNPH